MAYNLSDRQGRLLQYHDDFKHWCRQRNIPNPYGEMWFNIIENEYDIENGEIVLVPLSEAQNKKRNYLNELKQEYMELEKMWIVQKAYARKGYEEAVYCGTALKQELPRYMVPCGGGGEAQCTMFCEHYGGCIYECL